MNAEMVTCVMICSPDETKVLVQNRKRKYPGWSYPGGHVEKGESIYDCAVREVKEETGLNVYDLTYCGIVHWAHRETDKRYLCYMYKTTNYDGELIAETDEGEQFWVSIEDLMAAPKNRFSSLHYCLSPLFHEFEKYSEVFISWSGEEETWEVSYK